MPVLIICLLISYIPAVMLFIYLRNLRKEDAEYRKNCNSLLVRGILCSFLVILLALALNIVWALVVPEGTPVLIREVFKDFILAAFVEELIKYHTAAKLIKKNRETISWLDCMAFIAIVGIGFQIIESFVYMFGSNIPQILVRGFSMGHPAYGLLMGYLLGKSYDTGKPSFKVLSFMIPFLLHGLYDFSLNAELLEVNDNFVFLPFILVFIELFIFFKMLALIKKKKDDPQYTTPLLH